MGVLIPYMGNKRWLANDIADVIAQFDDGPFLDLFAGMCSVGQAVAPSRQIWCNEIQAFPALVAATLFCSQIRTSQPILAAIERYYTENLIALHQRFGDELQAESNALDRKSYNMIRTRSFNLPYIDNSHSLKKERDKLERNNKFFPYRLFTITYAGSYFGLRQSIQIDSLRYAIDKMYLANKIKIDLRNYFLVCLGLSAINCNNSTGHFAQFLSPTRSNIDRIYERRKKSIWIEFISCLSKIAPLGSPEWRKNNRCYRSDALNLLRRLNSGKHKPRIIYADPPYSSAQYSRYYHILDTIVKYNYPDIQAIGRYPQNRFQTPFSHKISVNAVMNKLVRRSAQLGAELVMSYPDNGLYIKVGGDLFNLLREYYQDVELVNAAEQEHSSFGGPAADPRITVEERMYVARNPKSV